MRADLDANARPCTLAYMHRPRFSSGRYANDVAMEPLWRVLYEFGADVVLAGHQHAYERFAPQDPVGNADPVHGIRQFIVGTGGVSLYAFDYDAPNTDVRDNTSLGVLKMTLHETSYDWEFIPAEGDSFTDSGSADCSITVPPPPPARTTAHVIRSDDDAEENAETGEMYMTSSDIDLVIDYGDEEGHGSVEQIVGIRFDSLDVPQGAAILNATIQFKARDSGIGPTALMILAEAEDDSPPITPARFNVSSRQRTAASVAWEPPSWIAGSASENERTPSLSSIVQEIVDRPGWSPGNAITFIVTGTGQRSARSYDFDPRDAPQLTVEFETR
jgi:hypothetical protein